MNHSSKVRAKLVKDWDSINEPGEFIYTYTQSEDPCGMVMCCPCGCGVVSGVQFKNHPNAGTTATWEWNGNAEKPTLSPSIRKVGNCKWHGHLVNGVFIPCDDSGK